MSGATDEQLDAFAAVAEDDGLAARAAHMGRSVSAQAVDELLPYDAGNFGSGRAGRTLTLQPFSQVKAVPTEWLWEKRIPLNALTLLAGPEGVGKTTLIAHLAAQVSRGELDGARNGQPQAVVIATLEDDDSDLRSMLDAAGADLTRVQRVRVTLKDELDGALRLPADVGQLERECRAVDPAVGPVGLLVIDPIKQAASSALRDDTDVRQLLGPLVSFAQSARMAVVISGHFKKGARDEDYAAWKVSGSPAWTQVPRSVLFLDYDPERPDEADARLIAHAKVNRTRRQPSLTARIETVNLPASWGTDETSRLVITGESAVSADDMRTTGEAVTAHARVEAEDFLRQYLSDGKEHVSREVVAACGEEGISERTLNRAASVIGVLKRREGSGGTTRSLWSLRVVGETGETGETQPLQAVSPATPATPANLDPEGGDLIAALKSEMGATEVGAA